MFVDQESVHVQQGLQRLASLSPAGAIPQGFRFLTQAGPLEVSFYAPDIVRLQIKTRPETDYGLLVSPPQQTPVSVTQAQGHVSIAAGETGVEVQCSPARIRLKFGDKVLLESVTDRTMQMQERFHPLARGEEKWQVALALRSGEPVYGLGEKFGRLDHRGELITSWNRDALGVNTEWSYKNAPFAWSPEGWGVFVHTPAKVTHGVGYSAWSQRTYALQVHDPNLDIFLIAGKTPADILEKYTLLTGRAPLPPTWSYGVWMARAFYRTADELLEVARSLRQRGIPCDVILLDGRAWHKMETRFDFRWDPDRYPDPASFVRKLGELNLRLCLWEYPYISTLNPLFTELADKGYLLRTLSGEPYIHRWLPEPFDQALPHLMPSGIIDLTHPDAYAWYRDQHKALFEIGVAVMKPDYGEAVPEGVVAHNGDTGKRLHNAYALLYNRCVYEATQLYGQGRPMVWGRAGWTGSQRYPIQWGGDPQCDWEGLAGSIRGGLSWGMSGGAFYTSDIGGFYGGRPDPELYVRWAQAGVMSSHTRFHGQTPREPWEFGEQAERIVKQWIEWRYRLIPYLEACALEASRTGMPVMRAMPLAFPDDPQAWGFEEQYMFGPSLLVAPVIAPGGQVRFYLPAGGWYDLWTGERLEGPRVVERTAPLDQIPVLGREGYLLPLGLVVQHTGELETEGEVKAKIDEVWAFGSARYGIEMPGQSIGVSDSRLANLPQGARVRQL